MLPHTSILNYFPLIKKNIRTVAGDDGTTVVDRPRASVN